PNVVPVTGAVRRSTSFRIALISQFIVTVNVSPPIAGSVESLQRPLVGAESWCVVASSRLAQPSRSDTPQGGLDAVTASWTIGSERDGPAVPCRWSLYRARSRRHVARAPACAPGGPPKAAPGTLAPGPA